MDDDAVELLAAALVRPPAPPHEAARFAGVRRVPLIVARAWVEAVHLFEGGEELGVARGEPVRRSKNCSVPTAKSSAVLVAA